MTMKFKQCIECNNTESIWWKIVENGHLCNKCYKRQWYLSHRSNSLRIKNPKEIQEQLKRQRSFRYYQKHKEKIKLYRENRRDLKREYDKKYREENRERLSLMYKMRRNEDVQFRLRCKLRERIKDAIRDNYTGKKKAGSAIRDLGCSVEELKKYLESKFKSGMTWENYGKGGWSIDHIKPLANFDLTDYNQFKQACHYTNLQPLWEKENISKGNR